MRILRLHTCSCYIAICPSYVTIRPSYVTICPSYVTICPSYVTICPSYVTIRPSSYVTISELIRIRLSLTALPHSDISSTTTVTPRSSSRQQSGWSRSRQPTARPSGGLTRTTITEGPPGQADEGGGTWAGR
jgi:hypothetical protein